MNSDQQPAHINVQEVARRMRRPQIKISTVVEPKEKVISEDDKKRSKSFQIKKSQKKSIKLVKDKEVPVSRGKSIKLKHKLVAQSAESLDLKIDERLSEVQEPFSTPEVLFLRPIINPLPVLSGNLSP